LLIVGLFRGALVVNSTANEQKEENNYNFVFFSINRFCSFRFRFSHHQDLSLEDIQFQLHQLLGWELESQLSSVYRCCFVVEVDVLLFEVSQLRMMIQ
jgi:hypothetical protein